MPFAHYISQHASTRFDLAQQSDVAGILHLHKKKNVFLSGSLHRYELSIDFWWDKALQWVGWSREMSLQPTLEVGRAWLWPTLEQVHH